MTLDIVIFEAIFMVLHRFLIVVLIYISLMTNYVENLFMCLMIIYPSSLVNCPLKFQGHFFIWTVYPLIAF